MTTTNHKTLKAITRLRKFSLPRLESFTILLFLSYQIGFSQISGTDATAPPYTPEFLVNNVLLGDGVEIQSIQYEGNKASIGYFKEDTNIINLERGVVLTTGVVETKAASLGIAEDGALETSVDNGSTVTDADIDAIAAIADTVAYNITKLTITFVPSSDSLRFNYVFASEEYPEFGCTEYNDIFGFFISGPGISGPYENGAENIALIPGTNLPVTINNIHPFNPVNGCAATYEQYYHDNDGQAAPPIYDGFLDVFTAAVKVIPCQQYTIKLVIADLGDNQRDSGVFLEAKSFSSEGVTVDVDFPGYDDYMLEECGQTKVTFHAPETVTSDYDLDIHILGTATNGVDYANLPSSLAIPAGQDSVSIMIIPFEDHMVEPPETVIIDYKSSDCTRDTLILFIKDNDLTPPELGNDLTICKGENAHLDGTVDVTIPSPVTVNSTDNNLYIVSPNNGNYFPVFSDLDISGVHPFVINEGVITSVCINIDHHADEDLDVFLIAPNGKSIALTTDNGGNGDNYTNTCFTPDAAQSITGGYDFAPASMAPFTGEFLPEDDWSELYGSPTNGTWRLEVIDDDSGHNGLLVNWSITFATPYDITYAWTPANEVSCADCPLTTVQPVDTAGFNIRVTDSYGCYVEDTITVFVEDSLVAPFVNLACANDGTAVATWDAVPNANGYEVSVNGGGWISPNNGVLSHQLSGLASGEEVCVQVRGIGGCGAAIGEDCCSVLDCSGLSVSIAAKTGVTCHGANDGTVHVTGSGGTTPYHYILNNTTQNTTGVFTGLTPGTYFIEVEDDSGCSENISFEITEPAELVTGTTVINNIGCDGTPLGSGSVTVSGGTYPYSFLWDNNQTDSIATGLTGGVHHVTVTDANDCTIVDQLTINEPLKLEISGITSTGICYGETNATATVTPEGGTPPYSYQWDANANNQTTSTAVNLGAGTYGVTITDDAGCTVSANVDVEENAELTLDITIEGVTCHGEADGTVTAVAAGGSPLYSYILDFTSENTIGFFDGLVPGTHVIEVEDVAGCTASTSFEIIEPTELSAYAGVINHVGCTGTPLGSANVAVGGGTYPYSFQWDNGQTDSIATNLNGGVHHVTVTDANDCTVVKSVTINEPLALEVSGISSTGVCFGETDGTATVVPYGGTPPYAYQWDAGANNQTTSTATGLSGGDYDVTVSDDAGCAVSVVVTVVENPEIQVNYNASDISCSGETDGTVTVSANGGTAPYFFILDYQFSNSTGTFTGIAVGAHQVEVEDEAGCSQTISFGINEPDALVTSTTVINHIDCTGSPLGSASVTVGGGTYPYTFLWDNAQTDSIATDLPEGDHAVTVTDAHGCSSVETVTINAVPVLIIDGTASQDVCFGETDGTATINMSGGTPPYTYQWDAGANSQTTATATGLGGGTYGVTVDDAGGCAVSTTVTVEENPEIIFDFNKTDIQCNGEANGTFEAITSGGTTPYTFTLDSIVQNSTGEFNGLTEGAHTVVLEDAAGCMQSVSFDIEEPEVLDAEVTVINNIGCTGTPLGSARVDISGGVTPYQILWDNGQQMLVATDLAAGIHDVTVTDAHDCSIVKNVTITQAPGLEIEMDIQPACYQETNGAVTLHVQNGTLPYTYQWDAAADNQTTPALTGLVAGTYSVTIQDAGDCSLTETVTIAENPEISLSVDTENITCYGQGDGRATAVVSGGSPDYTYQWSDDSHQSTMTATGLTAGDYQVTVTDAAGCLQTAAGTITAPEAVHFQVNAADVTCHGNADGSVIIIPEDTTMAYQYSLEGDDFVSGNTFSNLSAGYYDITILDENDCTYEFNNIHVEQPQKLTLFIGDDFEMEYGDSVQLEPQSNTSLYHLSFEWTVEDTAAISCINCAKPYVKPVKTMLFTATVTDESGCTATDELLVYVAKVRAIYAPNAFSPNEDDVNDYFTLYGSDGIWVNKLIIFDRWGEKVKVVENFAINEQLGWDGEFRGQTMKPNVFVWTANVTYPDGKTEWISGDVTIVR